MKQQDKNQGLYAFMKSASKQVVKKRQSLPWLKILTLFVIGFLLIQVLQTDKDHSAKKQMPTAHHLAQASRSLQKNLKQLKQMSNVIDVQKSSVKQSVTGSQSSFIDRVQAPITMTTTQNPLLALSGGELVVTKQNSQKTASDEVTIQAESINHPENTVVSGEFIHAILNVAINSSLPGMVSATVSHPVYAFTQQNVMIPKGSRVVGEYQSQIYQGQSRIFVIWNRLILPNGITIKLGSPSTDTIGQSGSRADTINRHFFVRFGQATLLSILGAGVATYDVDGDDQDNSASEYRSAVADSLQQSANQSLKGSIATAPTLTLHQGKKINIFVAHDLDFSKVSAKRIAKSAIS